MSCAHTNQAGSYYVVVTNTAGAVISSHAVLTVNVPPAPRITPPKASNGVVTFSFTPVSGLDNALLTNNSLSTGNWAPYTNFFGDGNPVIFSDPIGEKIRLYRLGFYP